MQQDVSCLRSASNEALLSCCRKHPGLQPMSTAFAAALCRALTLPLPQPFLVHLQELATVQQLKGKLLPLAKPAAALEKVAITAEMKVCVCCCAVKCWKR